MYFYKKKDFYPVYLARNDDRFFLVPFLLGGLAGGAAVGLSRPRPIYNVAPNGQMGNNPAYPAANYNYSYYVPNQMPYNTMPY